MKKGLFFIALFVSVIVMACNNANSKQTNQETETPAMSENMPTTNGSDVQVVKVAFKDVDAAAGAYLEQLMQHYFDVKNALVDGNAANAKDAAEGLLTVIKSFDKSLLTMKQKEVYDNYITNIQQAATDIAGTDQLEQQRTHFETLSTNLYELAKALGAGQKVYRDYCPMAFDNKGAYWLSETENIRNPYFGDMMLSCGKVKEIIE